MGWECTHKNFVGPVRSLRQAAMRFQMARAGRVDLSRGELQSSWDVRSMAGWLSTKKVRGVLGWCIRGPWSMALLSAEKLHWSPGRRSATSSIGWVGEAARNVATPYPVVGMLFSSA